MVIEDEISFLRRRARQEAELALTGVPEAATVHRKLAAAYLARLANAGAAGANSELTSERDG